MALDNRIGDFIVAVATDYKQLRTWISGSSTGDLTSLTTATKSSIIGAINEVNGKAVPAPSAASESVAGVAEVATTAETTTGTDDSRFISPLKLAQRLTAYAQPLSANLTTLAGVASGAFGRTLLATANAAAAKTALALTKADVGLSNVPNVDATARSNHSGTQPASTITGLAPVATSGSASDITTGTLPSSVMPPIAISDTSVVNSQAEMLALNAQRGDVAKRLDLNGQAFILQTEPATTLANWIGLNTTSDVTSVNGQVGSVVVTAADVGLGNANNTSDAAKPVSTAQAAADNLRLLKTANLSDIPDLAAARNNLEVFSKAAIGNPETDLVAVYTAAKA